MKKITVLLILVSFFLVNPIWAASRPEDDRRIEEQKRRKLKPAEETSYKEKKQSSVAAPLQPDDVAYLAEMSFRKITYGYDLCKLLMILKHVENEYIGLDAQVVYLKEQKLLPKSMYDTFDPMKPLRRGLTAYVLRKALNVKGGVFLRVFKESERYALKEMTHEGIMSSGNIHEIINGDALASTMTRAVNYLEGQ